MLKVAYAIGDINDIGGAEKQLRELLRRMKEKSVATYLICLTRNQKFVTKNAVNADFYFIPAWLDLRISSLRRLVILVFFPFLFLRTIRYLRKVKPDVVHTWLIHASLIFLPAAKISQIPVRIFARRGRLSGYSWQRNILSILRFINYFATSFTVNDLTIIDEMKQERVPGWKPIEYIPNGIVTHYIKEFKVSNPPVGIMLANFLPYKGHAWALTAMSKVQAPFRFEFYGDGPLKNELQAEIHRLNLQERVSILDYTRDTTAVLRNSDLLLSASATEAMSNSILEALASNVPVIATEVGAAEYLIKEGVNGFLVDYGDDLCLASILESVFSNPDKLLELSKSTEILVDDFRWDNVLEKYLQMYLSQKLNYYRF